MPRARRCIASVFFLAVLCLGSAVCANADPLTITLSNPNDFQTTPGSTIVLSGTLTNNTSSVLFVNSSGGVANINQPPGSHIVLSATYFIRPNLTTYVLQPGQSTGIVPLLALVIHPSAPNPSLTSGTIEICGGANAGACDPLGSVSYTVGVGRSPETPVPEPGTALLLGSGLTGAAVGAYRRRRARMQR